MEVRDPPHFYVRRHALDDREVPGRVEIVWATGQSMKEVQDYYRETHGERYLLDRRYTRSGIHPVAGDLAGPGRRNAPFGVSVELRPEPPREVTERKDLLARVTPGSRTFIILGVSCWPV